MSKLTRDRLQNETRWFPFYPFLIQCNELNAIEAVVLSNIINITGYLEDKGHSFTFNAKKMAAYLGAYDCDDRMEVYVSQLVDKGYINLEEGKITLTDKISIYLDDK